MHPRGAKSRVDQESCTMVVAGFSFHGHATTTRQAKHSVWICWPIQTGWPATLNSLSIRLYGTIERTVWLSQRNVVILLRRRRSSMERWNVGKDQHVLIKTFEWQRTNVFVIALAWENQRSIRRVNPLLIMTEFPGSFFSTKISQRLPNFKRKQQLLILSTKFIRRSM